MYKNLEFRGGPGLRLYTEYRILYTNSGYKILDTIQLIQNFHAAFQLINGAGGIAYISPFIIARIPAYVKYLTRDSQLSTLQLTRFFQLVLQLKVQLIPAFPAYFYGGDGGVRAAAAVKYLTNLGRLRQKA